ncbi:MAG: lipoate--protein ligase family protein [Paludibacter sp.]|jgi:lipoate-protein ligase A|nr:lipoate--protein ligase family protein [Paludibacter sp.]
MKILVSTYQSAEENLAAEEFLLSQTADDFILLYINDKTVILGNNQITENEVNAAYCRTNNIKITRRISGGGAVFHDLGNINYSFIGNKNSKTLALNNEFLKPIINVLHSLNIPVEQGKRNDLWLNGLKIGGTASHFSRNRYLFHGTLLYDSNLDTLQKALSANNIDETLRGTPSVHSAVGNIKEHCKDDFNTFFANFSAKIIEDLNADKYYFSTGETLIIEQLAKEKYRADTWNFRK